MAQREWSHRAMEGVPGSQVFDTATNWRLISECIRAVLQSPGIDTSAIRAVSTTSMREGMVLYDKRGREIWACPNVDSRAGTEATELVQRGLAEKVYRPGGDWVAITAPARRNWSCRGRQLRSDRGYVLAANDRAQGGDDRSRGKAPYALSRASWSMDDGGHRLLLRAEHAVVPGRVLRPGEAGSRAHRRRCVCADGERGRRGTPGLKWRGGDPVQLDGGKPVDSRQPSFRSVRRRRPGPVGPEGVHQGDRRGRGVRVIRTLESHRGGHIAIVPRSWLP